jgi:ACR3 family arsenite efflux pump ArsB
MKILAKTLGLIIVLVLICGAALLAWLHLKGSMDPAAARVVFDFFLMPFAAIMIGGFFFLSFITILWKELKK